MITVTGNRDKNGHIYNNPAKSLSPENALTSLVVFELGFGGHVVDLAPEKVKVVTRILECKER